MLVSQLNQKHAEWTRLAPFWERIDLLTCGGYEMLQRAAQFLEPQPMEPPSVYQSRLRGASYQNIFGTALGWYGSRLFHEVPQFHFRRRDTKFDDDGVAKFLTDSDRTGSTLVKVAQEKWFATLVSLGCVYIALDLPVVNEPLASERAQLEAGALDPYLVTFDPRQVYDWATDEHGNLSWIVIATVATKSPAAGEKAATVDRWYVYDRQNVTVYEAARKDDGKPDDKAEATVVRGPIPHPMADQKRVPVRKVQCPPELWFGWRVYPQVVEHFNAANARSWLLKSACVPIPWIKGEYTGSPKAASTEWLQLADNGAFGWTEPEGRAFIAAAEYVRELGEEIHRQMYLLAQARSSSATPAAQSGVSKQADMQPSSEVLDGFGAIFRALFKALLEDVLAIRSVADVTVDVQGLHFETDDLGEAETAQAVLDLGIPSETFKRVVWKRLSRCLSDADPDTQKKIDNEIDASPTEDERLQAAIVQQSAALSGQPPRPQAQSRGTAGLAE